MTSRMMLAALLPLGLAGLAPSVAVATSPAGLDQRGLVAAEDGRFQALVAQDLPAVARGMADEAMFGHLTGMRTTKQGFLDDIRSGKLPYRSVVARDRVAQVIGTAGITRGVVDMVVGERRLSDSYLAVYVWRDARWQLLDWQSAAPPPKPGERPWVPGAASPDDPASSPSNGTSRGED